MCRRLLLCGLCAFLSAAAGAAQEEGAALRSQLEIEEKLLAQEVQAYQQAREQQEEAQEAVREASRLLDEAVSRSPLDLDELDRLAIERVVAEAAARIFAQRVDEIQARILERARRAQVLRQELNRYAQGPAAPADPVSGRWRVQMTSPSQEGIFDLRLAGTVVEGSFRFEDGRNGSLRGSYVGDRLHLERIDSERGLDGVFEGTVDPALGVARGFWSPSLLSGGGPGGAGWSAVRTSSTPGEEEQEEEQSESG